MMGSSFEWNKDYDPRDYVTPSTDERVTSHAGHLLELDHRVDAVARRLGDLHDDHARLSEAVGEILDELQMYRSSSNPLGGAVVLRELQDRVRKLEYNQERLYSSVLHEQSKVQHPGAFPRPTKVEHWTYRDGRWGQVPHPGKGKGKGEDNSGLIAVLVLLVTAGIAAALLAALS